MELRADALVAFPRPLVFATYRDRIVDLLPYLPNVTSIEVRERKDEAPLVHTVLIWKGAGDIPAAARSFIPESALSWTDRATWDERDFTVKWRIETHAFTEAVTCEGTNRFVQLPDDTTRVEIRGDLTVDARKIRAVPRLLSRMVSRRAEEILVGHITPNLTETTAGVERHLKDHGPTT